MHLNVHFLSISIHIHEITSNYLYSFCFMLERYLEIRIT